MDELLLRTRHRENYTRVLWGDSQGEVCSTAHTWWQYRALITKWRQRQEMRCLRRAVNKTRRDKIKNIKIREMVGTTSILHHIQQQRIRWFGYPTRMAPHQLASKAYNTKMSGYKARGRPRKTWMEGVKETLKNHNTPPIEAFKLAADRKLFLLSTPRMVQKDG